MPFLSDYAAKCVFIVSPRFHYRRLAFCFLPLAAILESLYLNMILMQILIDFSFEV
jgi:hypothetical protein